LQALPLSAVRARARERWFMEAGKRKPGFYGWWLLFFLWIVYTIPIGFVFYGPPVLYPFMIEETGWSRGDIMVGYAAIMLLTGVASPLAAWMIGRLGVRVTLFIGGIGVAAINLAMALIGDSYPAYLALCVLLGLVAAPATFIPIQTVIIFWFSARRALALGLVLGGGAVGGFFAPQIVNAAVLGAGGDWRIGWTITGVAALVGAVVAVLAVRNRPSDLGQYPDGLPPDQAEATVGVTRTIRTYRTTVEWTLADALRTPALWLLLLATIGTFCLWQVLVTQGPLHLQDRGFEPADAAFFYSLAIGLSIAGRFSVAALGDIIEPRFIFAFALLCILIGGALFWFISPDVMWAAYLYPLLAGFGMGAAYICEATMVGNYWGPEIFAKIRGVTGPIAVIFEAGVPPLAGFLYDLQGTYLTIMIITGAAAILALFAILLCKPPKPVEQRA
jgi:MFS family permease